MIPLILPFIILGLLTLAVGAAWVAVLFCLALAVCGVAVATEEK